MTPTPRGGGIACALGIGAASVLAQAAGHEVAWPALVGAGALAVTGRVDDVRGLSPAVRLVAQGAVGAGMGWTTLGGITGAVLGAGVTAVAVNATNFMDGINGISGMTAALWGLCLVPVGVTVSDGALVGLGAATAGSALGFLPYNLPEAQLFLGDVGSYLFGGLFAGGVLLTLADRGPVVRVLAPLSVHLVDVSTTLVRRASRGAPLAQAHREHAYQRMVSDRGWTHLQASSAALAAAAAAVVSSRTAGGHTKAEIGATALPLITYYLAARPPADGKVPR